MFLVSAIYGSLLVFFASFTLFGKKEFEYLFISLFIVVSPIPFFAYTNAWIIKIYLNLAFVIFCIISIYKFLNINKLNLKQLDLIALKIISIPKSYFLKKKEIRYKYFFYIYIIYNIFHI